MCKLPKNHKTKYFHKDSLNSIDTVTNAKGEVILRNTYTPFGALLSSTNPSNDKRFNKNDFKGYTSHTQYYDLEFINRRNIKQMIKAYHFLFRVGRMYDPSISRFLSPDIYIQSPTNSQNFNRYSYVMNNPLKYTDPSGYEWDSVNGGSMDNVGGEQEGRDYMDSHDSDHDGVVDHFQRGSDGVYRTSAQEQARKDTIRQAEVDKRQAEIKNMHEKYEQDTKKQKIYDARINVLKDAGGGFTKGFFTTAPYGVNGGVKEMGKATLESLSIGGNIDALDLTFEIQEVNQKIDEAKNIINNTTEEDIFDGLTNGAYTNGGF